MPPPDPATGFSCFSQPELDRYRYEIEYHMQEYRRPDGLAPLVGTGKADTGGDIGEGRDEKAPGEAGEEKLPLVVEGEEEG